MMKSPRFRQVFVGLLTLTLATLVAGAGEAFTFVQMCDTQLGMGGYEHDVETFKLAVKQINALEPTFVVICGDLINDTNDDQAFADFNRIREGFEVACYPAAGNHDVGNEPTVELLERYRRLVGEDYYSVKHHGYTVAIVNTQLWKAPVEAESEKHDAWLRKTLEEAGEASSPVIVCGHYPLYVKEPLEEEQYFNIPPARRAALLKQFVESTVVAFLTGHAHRNIEHEYKGVLLITSATTSRNFDNAPMGYRQWHVDADGQLTHEFVAVEGAKPPKK
jgi:serine/threonine-protein phosphatase CPPED1